MQPALQPARATDVPAEPAASATPALPAVPTAAPATLAAPRTAAEVAGLRARLDALQQALRSEQQREREIVRDLRHPDPLSASILGRQLTDVNASMTQLRADIAQTADLIGQAPPAVAATVQPRREFLLLGPNGPSLNAIPVLLFLVLALQTILLRHGRGRRRDAFADAATLRDAAARLARLEQAVDAIAVEVERVSEGQRFVTRVFGEQGAPSARLEAPARPLHRTPA